MNPTRAIPDRSLPRGVIHYRVDVLPRANPVLSIEGDAGSGEWREVLATVTHPDAYNGERDIVGMKLWGNVDPNFHPLIAATEADSAATEFRPQTHLVLSAGAGVKTINARVYFRSGRYTSVATTYTLIDGTPHVTILRQPKFKLMSSAMPVTMAWSCSHAVTAFSVCVAPTYDAPRSACAPILAGTNISGTASAGQMVETSFTYAAALAAVPDTAGADDLLALDLTGQTFIKIFAETASGSTT